MEAVNAWLENDLGHQAALRSQSQRDDKAVAWSIDLQGDFVDVPMVKLVLPASFPAEPCWFEIDPRLELVLPHVERGGKLCLQAQSSPLDYQNPIGAVMRGMERLQDFLTKLTEQGWSEAEFHRERLMYWALHCTDPRRPTKIERRIGRVYLDASRLNQWSEGTVAGYLRPGSKHGHFSRQVVTCRGTDPAEIARRHEWAQGTLVKGNALILRLPKSHRWTPSTWPQTYRSLNALISEITHGEKSLDYLLGSWRPKAQANAKLQRFQTEHRGRQSLKPFAPAQLFVLFVQDAAVFGYQVKPDCRLSINAPPIEPFQVSRVDVDWTLARDHSLDKLHLRQTKRILLLGTGSLGSPMAQLLARSGLGSLTLVDEEVMESENTARHTLGLPHIGKAKAPELAEELRRLIPGLDVRGFLSEVCGWLLKNARPGTFDLIIDCTAESSVRTFIANNRTRLMGDTPVLHAWLEPLCSAGHVVLSQLEVPWPSDDPADSHIHASNISADDTRVDGLACAAGFHPYGAADVTLVSAFAVERILAVLDAPKISSTVWSWVRSQAFFDSLGQGVQTRSIVPKNGGVLDSVTVTRLLAEVLDSK